MSGPRICVSVEFYRDGFTRESFDLDLTFTRDRVSDDDLAEAVRDALVEHMEDHPFFPNSPAPERCDKTIDMFGVAP